MHAFPQAYAGNYIGHAKVERLLFIAEKKQGTAFGDDALRLALEELSQVADAVIQQPKPHCLSHTVGMQTQSDNTQRYQEVATRTGGSAINR